MKRNIKPLTPRCGLCKKLYSYREDDGSGLCSRCRPANSQPILVNHHTKQTIIKEVGNQVMDDFELEEQQGLEPILEPNEGVQEVQELGVSQELVENTFSNEEGNDELIKESRVELRVEDIIEQGRYGVSNSQMIPALKKAIAEESIEKLILLKKTYFYTYEKSVRYLKKKEREYIATNLQ